MIIDTHAHLYWDLFQEDYNEVIKQAIDTGVTAAINVGVDVKTSELCANLENDQIKFYSSIGIHPHEALRYTQAKLEKDIEKLEEIYSKNPDKVVGVGECGLDFLFESNPDWIPSTLSIDQVKDLQRKLFKAQIKLAQKLNLPLIIHCRDERSKNSNNSECWDEVLALAKDHFGILHCYSGLPDTTQRALKSNFLFSFAGNITYPKNEYLREAARIIPLDKIVVETDCPFLPPQNHRGARNEPAYITEVIKTIAQVKSLDEQFVKTAIFQNTKNALKLTL